MPEAPQDPPAPRPRRRRFRRRHLHILGGMVVVVLVAGAVVYVERGPIGASIARSYLKGRGIPAIIRAERLDPKGFTGAVVLGDPNDPDLSVRHVEVEFEPAPLLKSGFVAPRIRSVRLVEPRLKARWDGRRFTFGSLQRLVDDFSATPGTGPGPTVVIERGFARLATPYGELRLTGDGRLDQGRLDRLSAALQPTTLRQGGLVAQVRAATVQAAARNGRLNATAHLDIPRLARGASAVEALQGDVSGQLIYGQAFKLEGPFNLDAKLQAKGAVSGSQRFAEPNLTLALAGTTAGPLDRLALKGSAAGALSVSSVSAPGLSLGVLDLAYRFTGLDVARNGAASRFSLDAELNGAAAKAATAGIDAGTARFNIRLTRIQGETNADGGQLTAAPDATVTAARATAGLALRDATAELASPRAALTWRKDDWTLAAPLRTRLRAGALTQPVLAGDLTLRAVDVNLSGQAALGPATRLDLTGSARSGGGALSPAAAKGIADALPLIGADGVGRPALLKAFSTARLDAPAIAIRTDAGGLRLALPRPLQLMGTGGARLTVAARGAAPFGTTTATGLTGGAHIDIVGAGLPQIALDAPTYRARLDRGGLALQADTTLKLAFTGESLHGLTLITPAHLTRTNGTLTAALPDCADVTLAAFGQGAQPLLTNIRTEACQQGAGPALVVAPKSWRFATRAQGFRADAPAGDVQIRDGRGTLALNGSGGAPAGVADITAARVLDAQPMKRFEPLAITGRIALANDTWSGPVHVAEAAHGRPLAEVQVVHVMATATGAADIDAPHLKFAKGGLQPGDLSPLAGQLASEAEGEVAFIGRADWSPSAGVATHGRLTTDGVDFRSGFGQVKAAAADLDFTSLAPLVTAPAQPVEAEEIGWLIPLTKARATIALQADRLKIESAEAVMAKGKVSLDALDMPFAPNSALNGTVRLTAIDLSDLIDRFNLSDKLTIQAKIDGVVPFNTAGGALHLDKGHIFATAPGRISIKREALTGAVASAPGAPAPTGGVQDIAYQAMENLAFDTLEADIASQPMGRLGVLFHIKGRNDPPNGGATRISLFDLLRGKAFDKPIALPKGTPVNLTLDTSLNFDELLAAYSQRGRSEPVQTPPSKN